ncbi:MAG TPA: hypothetical protein VIC84_22570, partial [Blastocatellia bacterium]
EERPGVIELRCAIDETECTITEPDGRTHKSKAGWSGKRLIITAGELKETWDMDDDRKTLIITKEFRDIRWKMVYKRQ